MKTGSLRRSILLMTSIILACPGCNNQSDSQRQVRNSPGQLPSGQLQAGDRTQEIHATTFFAHGNLLERQGAFDRAIEQYQEALKLKSDFLLARNRLGITFNKLGRHADASEQFRLAIALRSDLAYLHNNLGFSLYLERKYTEAERSLARAIELKTDFARAHMNHALVLAKLDKFNEAFEELRKVNSAADAAFNMGMILTEAGRYADAARYLEAALQAKPNFEAARAQLDEVGRLAAAQDDASRARKAIDSLRVEPATPTPTETASARSPRHTSEPSTECVQTASTSSTVTTTEQPTRATETPSNSSITAADSTETGSDPAEPSEAAIADESASATSIGLIETDNPTEADAHSDAIAQNETSTTIDDVWRSTPDPTVTDDCDKAMHARAWDGIDGATRVAGIVLTNEQLGLPQFADEFDPNCTPQPIFAATPRRRPEPGTVRALLEEFATSFRVHADHAAEVLCRLETYLTSGEFGTDELSDE